MTEAIRVAIVDDHPLFREGVAATLREEERIEVVAQGSNADEALQICELHLPNVLLLDITMPGCGIAAARKITQRCPIVRIIMLTASESEEHVSQALEAGARGYVLKGIGAEELTNMIASVNSGATYITPTLAARVLSQMQTRLTTSHDDDAPSLTPREEQILGLVALGQTNKEIAIRLSIAEKTVKHYMTNIMQKLQVRNRVEAVLAVRDRLEREGKIPPRGMQPRT